MGVRSILIIVALMAVACASASEQARRATYPPEFRYIAKEKLTSAMWQLADEVTAINDVFRASESPTGDARKELIERLGRMQAIASALEDPGRTSTHPMIDAHMTQFRKDIDLAKKAAEAEPPNYFLAGAVAGSCMYCHAR